MSPIPHKNERRKWPRLALAIPIFIRSRDEKGKDFLEFATAMNVSAGGALLAVRRSLPLPAQVSLEIPTAPVPGVELPQRTERYLRARTLRVTHGEGYHLVGLKFAHPLGNGSSNGRSRGRKVGSLM